MTSIQTVNPETLLQHAGQWVALTPDRKKIVAAGESISEIESKLTDNELAHVVLKYVPAPDQTLSPVCRF